MSNDLNGRRGDETLLQQARGDDTDAFVELAARWWASVSRIASNMLGNVDEATVSTEEALRSELRSAGPSDAPFGTSLHRRAIRLTLARRRSALRDVA